MLVLLTLLFKVDIRYAVGASLVSVIAASSGAAAAYLKDGFSNIRIGMFLEIATTLGALFRGLPGRKCLDYRDWCCVRPSAALFRLSLPAGPQLSLRVTIFLTR